MNEYAREVEQNYSKAEQLLGKFLVDGNAYLASNPVAFRETRRESKWVRGVMEHKIDISHALKVSQPSNLRENLTDGLKGLGDALDVAVYQAGCKQGIVGNYDDTKLARNLAFPICDKASEFNGWANKYPLDRNVLDILESCQPYNWIGSNSSVWPLGVSPIKALKRLRNVATHRSRIGVYYHTQRMVIEINGQPYFSDPEKVNAGVFVAQNLELSMNGVVTKIGMLRVETLFHDDAISGEERIALVKCSGIYPLNSIIVSVPQYLGFDKGFVEFRGVDCLDLISQIGIYFKDEVFDPLLKAIS